MRNVVDRQAARTPEERVRLAERAMAVVNEHPDVNVRKLYAGEVAAQTGIPAADLVTIAERRQRDPSLELQRPRTEPMRENAEFAAITQLAQDWDSIAGWLIEELFNDDVNRRAFIALADADGNLDAAIEAADPDAREVLERSAVADLDVDAETEARNLIAAAVRRELAARRLASDANQIQDDREARLLLEDLTHPIDGAAAAEGLLGWLHRRMEQRTAGGI